MTEVITVTDAQFIAAVDQAVETRGRDHVYARYLRYEGDGGVCYYRHPATGKADCLFGVTLDILGIVVSKELEQRPIAGILAHYLPELSDKVINAATYGQSAQDRGRTWGQSKDEFHSHLDDDLNLDPLDFL